MRKWEKRTREVHEEHVVEMTCNVCGEFKVDLATDEYNFDRHNLHPIACSGGYGTDYPHDMETIEFEVCSACLLAWVQTFKIPPTSSDED